MDHRQVAIRLRSLRDRVDEALKDLTEVAPEIDRNSVFVVSI